MSIEYLRTLHESVQVNPSQIKTLIEDLPRLKDQLLFSNLKEDKLAIGIYCNLLELLIKRISVSSRRSKQAFTSMWDKLRGVFEMILNDGLGLKEEDDEKIIIVLRRILQMNIKPTVSKSRNCSCDWLAMDLDTQLKEISYSRAVNISHLTNYEENELNLKSLHLYCDQFTVKEFPKVFLNLTNPTSDLVNLFFKPQYFSVLIASEYIYAKQIIAYDFIVNLKNIQSTFWLEFDTEALIILINKLKPRIQSSSKEAIVIYELFEVICLSMDYRDDSTILLDSFVGILIDTDIKQMSDAVLCKFWCFVSALLSCECFNASLKDLETKIIFTLDKPNEFGVKGKISVSRVISLYWNELSDQHDLIVTRLIDSALSYENNKLRWNVATTLMNCIGEERQYEKIKKFWLEEMKRFGNFKVILSYTKLLVKWTSSDYEGRALCSDPESFEVVWTFLNRLKLFLTSNLGNLECEDGEGLVEIGDKLEEAIKSILIGGNVSGEF